MRRAGLPRPNRPHLTRVVHRDLAQVLADWPRYFHRLGSAAFTCLFVLESIRIHGRKPHRIHFSDLARELAVSNNTLRRWLRALKRAGLISTRFVPGSHNAEAYFDVHLTPGHPANWTRRGPRRRQSRTGARHSPR